jgi:hypothetical protein
LGSKKTSDPENPKKKIAQKFDINIQWTFIDFDDETTVGNLRGDEKIVSICWALNETNVNRTLWTKVLLKLENCLILIIEGDMGPLLPIIQILDFMGREYYQELYENPRRLIIYPKGPVE